MGVKLGINVACLNIERAVTTEVIVEGDALQFLHYWQVLICDPHAIDISVHLVS